MNTIKSRLSAAAFGSRGNAAFLFAITDFGA
jgi:hypothetical protein